MHLSWKKKIYTSISLLFSHWIVSDSLQLYVLQHTRISCPSLSPRVCSNSCPLSWWCNSAINHLIIFCPLLLPLSVFPRIKVFSNQSALRIRWPKYWSVASASILPMNIQGWFPFRTDWFYLLEVQGTLKSLLHDHNLKASGLPLKCHTLPSQ